MKKQRRDMHDFFADRFTRNARDLHIVTKRFVFIPRKLLCKILYVTDAQLQWLVCKQTGLLHQIRNEKNVKGFMSQEILYVYQQLTTNKQP